MRLQNVVHILGLLLVFLGASMLLPIAFAIRHGGGDLPGFIYSALITSGCGALAWRTTRITTAVRSREVFAVVSLGWLSFSLLGCLPFILTGHVDSFTDAFFETMSGFTTTGATILTDIEALPHGLLFWRSFTHWVGGMGIIVLSLAILPYLGVGGMQLFKAEVPGPLYDKLTPRIAETAKLLWVVYLLFSAVQAALLMLGGMNLFDALCHTFGTMATGGFSTRNASIGAFESPFIQYVIILFMLSAGLSFSLHYRLLRGSIRPYWDSREARLFLALAGGATLFLGLDVFLNHVHHLEPAFRQSLFQAVSILTTTGYGTADYEQWSLTSQFILFCFMFIGGCAGSTAGGIKVIRLFILIQFVRAEFKRLIHPSGVIPVRVGPLVIPREVAHNVLGFFVLVAMLFVAGVLILTLLGIDLVTSFGAVAACIGNIGPGLGSVGPSGNYAHLPAAAKWMLAFFMLMGRLEIFTVLVLLAPSYWRK